MRRRHLLGMLLDGDTGRAFHGSALPPPQTVRVIKRTAYEEYEREMQLRAFTRRVVVVCALAMLACIVIAYAVHHVGGAR